MKGRLTVTWLLSLTTAVLADYDCLCNQHVETAIYQQPDSRLSPIGYLYEFDCQPAVSLHGLDQRWQAVAKDHKLAYVLLDSQIKMLTCAGRPPPGDDLPTTARTTERTSTTATTLTETATKSKTINTDVNTFLTETNIVTGTTSPRIPANISTTNAAASKTPANTNHINSIFTAPMSQSTHITAPTVTATNSTLISAHSPAYTHPSTHTDVSTHVSTHTNVRTSHITAPTQRSKHTTLLTQRTMYSTVPTQRTTHTTVPTQPTTNAITITQPTTHTISTHTHTVKTALPHLYTHSNIPTHTYITIPAQQHTQSSYTTQTTTANITATAPSPKTTSPTPPIVTTRFEFTTDTTQKTNYTSASATPILTTGRSVTQGTTEPSTVATTVNASSPMSTTRRSIASSMQSSTTAHVTVQPADISPEMSQSVLFLLNEERTLRAQLDSDADELEKELVTLTGLRKNATCGCPSPWNNPVAFTAVLTHDIATLGVHQVIVFDHVYTNYGNAYDVRHGVFTTPVTGAYDFSVAMLVANAKNSGVEIVVNTTPLAKTRSGDDSFYTMGTNAVVVQLTAGDEVFVRHISETDNNVIYGQSFSSFSGHLIG